MIIIIIIIVCLFVVVCQIDIKDGLGFYRRRARGHEHG